MDKITKKINCYGDEALINEAMFAADEYDKPKVDDEEFYYKDGQRYRRPDFWNKNMYNIQIHYRTYIWL